MDYEYRELLLEAMPGHSARMTDIGNLATAEALVKQRRPIDIGEKDEECVICLETFVETDIVTALPCDPRHFFHSACIERWVFTNDICPLCKKNITLEQSQFIRDGQERLLP